MRRSSRVQWLCIEKSLGFVIREITECVGQMRIVYFDLAQLQLHIGLGEVFDDALAFLHVARVVERLKQVLAKALLGEARNPRTEVWGLAHPYLLIHAKRLVRHIQG